MSSSYKDKRKVKFNTFGTKSKSQLRSNFISPLQWDENEEPVLAKLSNKSVPNMKKAVNEPKQSSNSHTEHRVKRKALGEISSDNIVTSYQRNYLPGNSTKQKSKTASVIDMTSVNSTAQRQNSRLETFHTDSIHEIDNHFNESISNKKLISKSLTESSSKKTNYRRRSSSRVWNNYNDSAPSQEVIHDRKYESDYGQQPSNGNDSIKIDVNTFGLNMAFVPISAIKNKRIKEIKTEVAKVSNKL